MALTETELQSIKEIAEGLAKVFAGEPEKITYWLMTRNMQLGGISPATLIQVGRAHKVAQFVSSQVREQGQEYDS